VNLSGDLLVVQVKGATLEGFVRTGVAMKATGSLAAVYDSSYPRLVAQLVAICGSQQEAEDAVQEAFVKAVGQGSNWEAVDNPEAWLRTVALNHLRTRWRRGQLLRRLLPQVPGPVRPLEPSPDRLAVEAALAQLKTSLRTVVVLHYLADLSVATIAAELDVPEGTVKSRLAKARAVLGTELLVTEEADHA
jgi:RNA polymerase sigma-70 factor (ECF subfamily)